MNYIRLYHAVCCEFFKGELNQKTTSFPLKAVISGYLVVLLIDSGHNLDILVQSVLNIHFVFKKYALEL